MNITLHRTLMVCVLAGALAVMALTSCGGGSQETRNPTNSTPSIVFMREDSDGFQQTWSPIRTSPTR